MPVEVSPQLEPEVVNSAARIAAEGGAGMLTSCALSIAECGIWKLCTTVSHPVHQLSTVRRVLSVQSVIHVAENIRVPDGRGCVRVQAASRLFETLSNTERSAGGTADSSRGRSTSPCVEPGERVGNSSTVTIDDSRVPVAQVAELVTGSGYWNCELVLAESVESTCAGAERGG